VTCDCFLGITLNSNFHDITDDIDDARAYGGIHFRFDQQAALARGDASAFTIARCRAAAISLV